jgi:hypothetical protein
MESGYIPSDDTKSRCVDDRQVPDFMTDVINHYIETHRPVLCGADIGHCALWVTIAPPGEICENEIGDSARPRRSARRAEGNKRVHAGGSSLLWTHRPSFAYSCRCAAVSIRSEYRNSCAANPLPAAGSVPE